ncbi:MAG TPA: glycogen debranching N-terminal domain-containing protein [Anaeromyxobacteraceae bacterium]|nr:glycogen debranching N-terminal domain-containing protein [Anaeromyxobacteraceae bacterium]
MNGERGLHAPAPGAGPVADPVELLGYADPSERPEATRVEKLVLKRRNLFLVAARTGDVSPPGARDLGLFLTDTRHLSFWSLTVEGGPPIVLSSQVSTDYVSQIDLTVTSLHRGNLLGKEPVNYVHLRRDQLIDDGLVDRFLLTNFVDRPIDYWIELAWAADFADVFEIRGARRPRRGTYRAPQVFPDGVLLGYEGLDRRRYATRIRIDGPSCRRGQGSAWIERIDGAGARIAFRLGHGEAAEACFVVHAEQSGRRAPAAPPRPFGDRAQESAAAYRSWAGTCTRFDCSNDLLDSALAQAIADLEALTVVHHGEPVVSAGIPWYTCPFGRDALITGFEALLATPEVARRALLFLAALQGKALDPSRDEEPGKIPHEVRFGEMATAGEVPHTPYYGSIDATPLFLVLLDEYHRWTADRETVEALLPAAERALGWLDRYADRDGDGLVEYERGTPLGLRNQGWKDSHDGVPFASGRPAEPPIALVEVQGYCVDAWRRMAGLYRELGGEQEADRLELAAQAMVERIEARYWMEARGTYAIAIDRDKRQVDAVTSNPGHLLFSRAIGPERARRVADGLIAPPMWSGWGIRTLGAGQPAYNPLSYHDGTVWPHDNAMAAMGMAYYGHTGHAARVFEGLWAAAQHFRHLRLPELFCGLDRHQGRFPVHYPVACSPQAWASGAWFLLLRAMLGLRADAPRHTLHVFSPRLPAGVDRLELKGLRVGPARATLDFTRVAGGTFVAVTALEGGPLHVKIDVTG